LLYTIFDSDYPLL